MTNQSSSIGDHCAIYEFRNAEIAHNGTSDPVLVVTGVPPSPGMQMFVRPMPQDETPQYWPYLVFYCFTQIEPHPGVQVVSIPLQQDKVGKAGVEVVGDTLRIDLKVSFGETE
jgi:hypothetical protein